MNLKRLLLFVAIAAVLGVLFAWLWQMDRRRFDWRESYSEESRQPYGTAILQGLLEDYFPASSLRVVDDSLSRVLSTDSLRAGSYVFVGEGLWVDSSDIAALLTFVGNGNQALISSRSIPNELMTRLYPDACPEALWEDYTDWLDTVAQLNFYAEKLRADKPFPLRYLYRNRARPYRWQYISEDYLCGADYGLTPLGYFADTLVNFVSIPYGEGEFYLHTTPLAFTNYYLVEPDHLAYVEGVFSHLREGPIYWESYNRILETLARRRNQRFTSNARLPSRSPLQYILRQPPLAWAWYLLIAAGGLYLIFRAKRRQRVIPVKESNANTSRDFVSTIGRLYFLQNNHRQLALQKMRLLLGFIREHYHLQTRELDTGFAQRLALKSEVPQAVIDKILLLYRNIDNSNYITENTLIEFHGIVEQFYRQCK